MLNKWIGQGRLVRDIETRTAKNDTQIAMFTIACNRDYGDETDFIDCRQTGVQQVGEGRRETHQLEDRCGTGVLLRRKQEVNSRCFVLWL